jgi:D-hexose-6-phosphate mutarotase
MATLSDLQKRFTIPNVVSFQEGLGGLPRAKITTPLARAEVYLHGAHVTGYQPAGQPPVLWMSGKSAFHNDKAIRGGIPICFPWFGAREGKPSSPSHGFARLKQWDVESVTQPGDGSIEIILTLNADEQTLATWPHEFALRYHVRIGRVLECILRVRNDGLTPFTFEEALHTYLHVGDVQGISITGLESTTYLDKTDAMKHKPQGADPVTIAAETDRVYTKTRTTAVVDDPDLNRRLNIAKEGSDATVIWNPWIAKAKAMPDFGDEEFTSMICIETANVGDSSVTLPPGETHEMRAAIGVTTRS